LGKRDVVRSVHEKRDHTGTNRSQAKELRKKNKPRGKWQVGHLSKTLNKRDGKPDKKRKRGGCEAQSGRRDLLR